MELLRLLIISIWLVHLFLMEIFWGVDEEHEA
jgi:hypothetical protein